ncbi:MAG TPA: DUF1015 domain-containing protein, partial [Gemmataceae bacterium]|nr:DUF1015 domain-containing protein [Gemmataceae bacterium]
PYNAIRLELNKVQKTDTELENCYTRAAQFLRDWQREGILMQDSARSLYVYEQAFMIDGQPFTRRGFFARMRLEPFGQGKVFAHEETMAGPKADRLKLLNATGMNLSPIFGLYPDPTNEVQSILDAAKARSLPLEATDQLGVVSRLWPVADQKAVSKVIGLMGPKPVFIADGHHRYETGLRYIEERRAAGELVNEESPSHFILVMLVSMSDPGLLILPTHRLISGFPNLTSDRLRTILAPYFEFQEHGNSAIRETWDWIAVDGGQNVLGFGTVADGKWMTARLKSPEPMERLAGNHSANWRGLGVAILHVLILDHLLANERQGQPSCKYVHSLNEVEETMATRQCDLAVLVPPAAMNHVESIAGGLEKMPPKSTYFYPKVLSGLVFNSVKK